MSVPDLNNQEGWSETREEFNISLRRLSGFSRISGGFVSEPFVPDEVDSAEWKSANTTYSARRVHGQAEIVPERAYISIINVVASHNSRDNIISTIIRVFLLEAEVLPMVPDETIRDEEEKPIQIDITIIGLIGVARRAK